MKPNCFIQCWLIAAAVTVFSSAAWGTDVGLPLYAADIGDKSGSIEVYYFDLNIGY